MRYLSVCSGIEAATVAWHPLGWTPVGFAEIDKFACAVLAERFGSNLPGQPLTTNGVPNFGDFTAMDLTQLGPVDLLVGGTPCQAFSFAGKRQSLADARGNLTLAYAVLAHELARSHGLRNALWENVPGVLSTEDNAFGCFLGALVGADAPCELPRGVERWPDAGMVAGPRARAAWRVLDAQYFGLAQRRERVFVVIDLGNGADPAAVLFEPQSLQGNTAPSREARKDVAPTLAARTKGGGGLGTDFDLDGGLIAFTCKDYGQDACVDLAPPVRAMNEVDGHPNAGGQLAIAFDTTQITSKGNYSNPRPGDPCHPLAATAHAPAIVFPLDMRQASRGEKMTNNRKPGSTGGAPGTGVGEDGDPAPTVAASHVPAVAYAIQAGALRENPESGPDGIGVQAEHAYTLEARAEVQAIAHGWAVRRLTPVECARLQGFPDHHARISWRGKPAEECPDGSQYKVYGNSMAVKNMRWLGERIELGLRAD
jgi:DNA (cytosine-5)-methyltransferase 1